VAVVVQGRVDGFDHEVALLLDDEVYFLAVEEAKSARELIGAQQADELEVTAEGTVDLL
jgi:hypothetical protein